MKPTDNILLPMTEPFRRLEFVKHDARCRNPLPKKSFPLLPQISIKFSKSDKTYETSVPDCEDQNPETKKKLGRKQQTEQSKEFKRGNSQKKMSSE